MHFYKAKRVDVCWSPCLIHTLERWDRLALVLVERLVDDTAVLDLDVGRVDVVLPGEGVLHPVVVVALCVCEACEYVHGTEGGLPRTSGKSSRAWAPRDSLRAAAAVIVWTAH